MKQELPITILSSPSEIEKLRDIWACWQDHPNSDIDFFLTIANARKDRVTPYVIVIGPQQSPNAIAVGRLEDSVFQVRIGYKSLYRIKLKTIVIIHGGLLGEFSPASSQTLLSALMKALRAHQAEAFQFSSINVDAEIAKLVRHEVNPLCREHFVKSQFHWKMMMPNRVEELLSGLSREHRNQLRRNAKKLEADVSAPREIRCFRKVAELEQMFKDVEQIARKTYQRGLGVGFIDNVENRNRLMLEAEKGWLHMYVLYLTAKPCAYWWGVLYRDTFHSCALGFDPECGRYSPGTYLLMKGLESLCQEGVKELDFGLGDARYKQQFGNKSCNEASISIFAPTLRAMSLNLILTLTNGMALIARRILGCFKADEILKTNWRRRLRPVDHGD